ncbi:MAG TPA: imelysin family protein [Polyangiales bacterium]|nr:imelysin family protein [Polyangiales bacterium]
MHVGRRVFLSGLGGLSLAAVSGGCRRESARELALRGAVERVTIPDTYAITLGSRELHEALEHLQAGGSLEGVRAAWRRAAVDWQRGFAFQHGPVFDTKALLHASFWPVRTQAIATILSASDPIDAQRVAQLGVNAKGIFAIEHLLFEEESPGVPWALGSMRDRALVLMRAFAADVRTQAEQASGALGNGRKFMDDFARGGQQNLNRVVNELTRTVEHAVIRIDRVLATSTWRGFSLRDVQGGPSGTSTELLAVSLSVCARVYGVAPKRSLAGLVQAVSPAIHAHAMTAFGAARSAVQGLGQPYERLVQSNPAQLTAAKDALRQLEVVLRSEVASALGVTITFGSGDGD